MARKRTEPYLVTHLHRKGGRLGMPIGGTFELTARCNFNCPMCYVHLGHDDIAARGRELSTQQWIDLARDARDAGMVFVLLTGGEPFLRKDFFEIYDALKELGLIISINTNGSLLEGETLKRLLKDPPFRINISLYGGCAETYQKMCGQNAFDRVVENIRALKNANVDVSLNLSITPYNRQDMERIYHIAQELGVQVKGTAYMYPPIRINGEQFGTGNRLSAAEAAACSVQWDRLRFSEQEFLQRARAMRELKLEELPECTADLEEGVRCRAGHSSFWMAWDGTMLPCAMLPTPAEYPLKDGFRTAWERIRSGVKSIRTPGACAVCPKREVCGVCAAICLTETGSFHKVPGYKCEMTDEIIRGTCKILDEREEALDETEKATAEAGNCR